MNKTVLTFFEHKEKRVAGGISQRRCSLFNRVSETLSRAVYEKGRRGFSTRFAGFGTTLVTAEELGREAYGIEF